ncbi:hypothetical protein Tco_0176838 [Tanacetum coccineum]
MTETTHESASQEKSYDKFLNLDNAPPVIDEVASMMNVKTSHEELCTQAPPNNSVTVTAIPKISTVYVTIVTLIIQPFSSILQMTTAKPVPTTKPTTSLVSNLLDFASLFGFDQRVELDFASLSRIQPTTEPTTSLVSNSCT